MSKEIENEIKEVKSIIRMSLSQSDSEVWPSILNKLITYFEKPVGNMIEIKSNSTYRKGRMFEVFCKLYLQVIYQKVWLLSEVPAKVLEQLSMKSQDKGIDLVAVDEKENYYAIQCKYRKPPKQKTNALGWKELSTFYSLCFRTGDWRKMIVMTNCEYIRREGKKSEKDKSVCYKTFLKTKRTTWLKIIGDEGQKLDEDFVSSSEDESDPKAKIRKLRKKFLAKVEKEKVDTMIENS